MKPCSVCGEAKPLDDFYKDAARRDGHKAACAPCYAIRRRSERLAVEYGITAADYDRMLDAQARGCAICGIEVNTRRLDVDHCHATGVVRGLLCRSCNTTLGRLYDCPDLLRVAALYLEQVQ